MKKTLLILGFSLALFTELPCFAEDPAAPVKPEVESSIPLERAKGEKLATAMGYFARARSLLISSLREFDKGLALVDPNALLDSRMWRAGVSDRVDELTRVLDPQPRATKGGIKYGNETVGIGDASKR